MRSTGCYRTGTPRLLVHAECAHKFFGAPSACERERYFSTHSSCTKKCLAHTQNTQFFVPTQHKFKIVCAKKLQVHPRHALKFFSAFLLRLQVFLELHLVQCCHVMLYDQTRCPNPNIHPELSVSGFCTTLKDLTHEKRGGLRVLSFHRSL